MSDPKRLDDVVNGSVLQQWQKFMSSLNTEFEEKYDSRFQPFLVSWYNEHRIATMKGGTGNVE